MTRMRVLFVASTAGHIEVFHAPHIATLVSMGHVVDVATGPSDADASAVSRGEGGMPARGGDVPFARAPWSWQNVRAARKLACILKEADYAVVHCHTPTAGAITRIVAWLSACRAVIVYTCHGLHFYPGAPWRNWALWFTTEFLLARITDVFVTINRWDYDAASRWLRARQVRYVPGVGVDLKRFAPADAAQRGALRKALTVPTDACVMVYVAEFIPRKQHRWLLNEIAPLMRQRQNLRLLLVGNGPLVPAMTRLINQLGLADRVQLLGFRRDVADILRAADLAVSTSRHEGLPMGVAEAMATGLPVVVSQDRGHRDLVTHGEDGFIFEQGDRAGLSAAVQRLVDDPGLRERMGSAARRSIARFSLDRSVEAIRDVHREALDLYEARTSR